MDQAERLIPFLTDSVIQEVKYDAKEITVDWDPVDNFTYLFGW